MPYQFENGDLETVSLLDSSEDEGDVVISTSRRYLHRSRDESTVTATDVNVNESPVQSGIDEVDTLEHCKKGTRPRLQNRSTLNLRREIEELDINTEEVESESDSDGVDVAAAPYGRVQRREAFKEMLGSMEAKEDIELLYPKSLHPDFHYTDGVCDEDQVLIDFVNGDVATQKDDDTFEELEMQEFSIYRGILHGKGYNGQFESPHVVCSEQDAGIFYLDGIVRHDGAQRRIVGAVIHDVNIGGLNDTAIHTSACHIWVQTKHSYRRHRCWYRLHVPSDEYSITWHDFLWLADLNKHMVDYLCDACTRSEKIHLRQFETAFWDRLLEWHEGIEDFDAWSDRCGRVTDFRMHITIHASFLRDQAWSISGQESFQFEIMCHPVWTEIGVGKFMEDQQGKSQHEKTIVTPNVGSTFIHSFPKWSPGKFNLLSPVQMSPEVAVYRSTRRLHLEFPEKFPTQPPAQVVQEVALLLEKAATINKTTTKAVGELVGKVVIVRPPATHNTSKDQGDEHQFRFALVHEVTKSSEALKVIYLALPTSTICGSEHDRSFYPITNELFYTDRCNCRPISLNRVVDVHEAAIYPDNSENTNGIMIQLLYREEDSVFVTPQISELLCTCQSMKNENLVYQPHSATLRSHRQEFPTLYNMSLFSGCGLLDHGMEEGSGLIETVFAIDHNEMAMYAHAANSTSEKCTHVVGSVNIHLEHFLRGKTPLPEIDCVTAGSPCKGFSLLNAHRKNKNAQRNCSLLASVLSWIELFLPRLALIENVPRMDHIPNDRDLANASAQAICCLVAIGYQVRKVLLTAYEHGSPTLRRRLFIIAAAPGVPLPEVPRATHGDDSELERIVTVGDVLQGLKAIHNDVAINIRDPTQIPIHRLKPDVAWRVSLRNVVKRIPKIPGDGLYQAYRKGLLSRDQKRWYYAQSDEKKDSKSKSLRRVDPQDPFKTIVTVISPLDSRFSGEIVHPHEDRVLSLKEIRRAQGVPDWFLLVGSLRNQVELVGNGVAWQVAAALGRSISDAWRTYCGRIDGLGVGEKNPQSTDHISVPLPEYKNTMKIEDALPGPGYRSPPRSESATEEVFEVSEHESLVVTPDGTFNHQRSQRGKMVRRSDSAKQTKKPVPMVIIPTQKKRAASPTPSPAIIQPEAAKQDIDSDIEYLETRPVTKKKRVTARVEDWYN